MNQASFFENPYEKRAIQTWNCQNVQGKSRVIVGDGNNAPDQLGKPKSDIDHKPLGLPVRSLRSRIVDGDTTETIDLGASSSRLKACSNFGDEVKIGKFRGLVPINLEKKFEETLEPSRIPRGLKIWENGNERHVGSSVSSHASAKHSLWKMPDSKLEDVNRKKTSDGFKDSLTAFDKSKTGEVLSRGMQGVDSLNSDLKPATLPNGLSRGKSVRTIRSSEQFLKGRKSGKVGIDHIDDEVGLRCEKLKGDSDENSMRRAGLRNLQAGRRKGIDNLLSRANSTFLKHQNAGKQDFTDSDIESEEGSERGKQDFADSDIESEEGLERELDNFHVSSNEEEAGCHIVSGSESESDEVDRKANEFIAKFREQIRLQKVTPVTGLNYWSLQNVSYLLSAVFLFCLSAVYPLTYLITSEVVENLRRKGSFKSIISDLDLAASKASRPFNIKWAFDLIDTLASLMYGTMYTKHKLTKPIISDGADATFQIQYQLAGRSSFLILVSIAGVAGNLLIVSPVVLVQLIPEAGKV
ncbi:hypothetical protein RJ640_010004 [Escallonia rubra]|uniref:Uncharacterized protein n=1 Tax=Escallonia rubra TaxID=112253 RepID=A0AA88TZL7_9ASTE|nr:hypothetical protein RJ640_010004 [Escallonia rubra]